MARACSLAAKNIPTKTTIPIVKSLHVEVSDDSLKVSSTDTETWVVYEVPADVELSGLPNAFCVDASSFTGLLQAIPSQPITVELKEKDGLLSLKIQHSSGSCELPAMSALEFPSLKSVEGAAHTVSADSLKRSIQTCRFALYGDAEARPSLASLCIDFKGQSLVAVSSDMHTIARLEHTGVQGEPCQYLLSPKTIALLLPMLDDALRNKEGEDAVVIRQNGNTVCFKSSSVEIHFCQTHHRYPNYDSVIPARTLVKYEAVMSRLDLLSAITRASLFASADTMRVTFSFRTSEEHVSILAEDVEFATSGVERVKCEFDAYEDFSIAFSAVKLKDILLHMSSSQVRFSMIGSDRAAIITEADGNPDLLMLLMPMMIGV